MNQSMGFTGYIITNIVTKKQYVGITSKTVQYRLNVHFLDSTNKRIRYKNHLHNSIRKHGKENFKIECIKKAETWEEICQWEISAITEFNTKAPNGYNLTNGGEGAFGFKRSKETNLKSSKIKIEFYKDQNNRDEQSARGKAIKNKPEAIKFQKAKSKELWKNEEYRNKTIKRMKQAWDSGNFNEKHRQAVIASTANNPEWMERNNNKNLLQSKDPEWRNKVKMGIRKYLSGSDRAELNSINRSNVTKKYWDDGHEDRREKHAKTMSEMINKNLNNPEYQKWRKNNPPGGKPIQYNYKFFRSSQEAVGIFNAHRDTINRHILQNKPGCRKLEKCHRKNWPWEIKHD